jgi:hypothetical protein
MATAVMVMATVVVAEMAAFQEYGAQSVRLSPVITSHTRTFRAPVSDEVKSAVGQYCSILGQYHISHQPPSFLLLLKTDSKLARFLFLSDLKLLSPYFAFIITTF